MKITEWKFSKNLRARLITLLTFNDIFLTFTFPFSPHQHQHQRHQHYNDCRTALNVALSILSALNILPNNGQQLKCSMLSGCIHACKYAWCWCCMSKCHKEISILCPLIKESILLSFSSNIIIILIILIIC